MNEKIRHGVTAIPNFIIDDKTILRDSKYLFILICSKPVGFKFTNKMLCESMSCSEDSLRKYTKELEDKKYLIKRQVSDQGGRFSHNVYKLIHL